ncbi:AAA family ATPase [Enterococcus faecalis]|nr:AAA family ATPase [Enterococcus faecalis]
MAKIITTGNLKGGVGKTTNAVLLSYTLARKGYKTCLLDFDMQADATDLVFTTMEFVYKQDISDKFEYTFYGAIKIGQPQKSIIKVTDNWDLIPSDTDLVNYQDFLDETLKTKKDKDFFLDSILNKIKDNYDYIIIDVPPTINIYTDSAIVASDYILIVLQTQMKSYRKAVRYANYLSQLRDTYDLNVKALGILPVLMENNSEYDEQIINQAKEEFGPENIFKNPIKQLRRIKRFDWTGITNNTNDSHDKKVHSLYEKVANELIIRIGEDENNDN